MPKSLLPSGLALALVLISSTPALRAAEKIDLDRVVPVPANQPIPIQDFFRSRALAQPILNRDGTRIAAIATAGEDKHLLMVYDIATAKVNSLGFNADRDIYNVYWMTNTSLVFQLSSRKQYGLGIMVADVANLGFFNPVQQYNGSSLLSVPLKDPTRPIIWNRYHLEDQRDVGVVAASALRNAQPIDLTNATNDLIYMQKHAAVRENNDRAIVRSYPLPAAPGLTYGYMTNKEGELAYAF